MNMMKSPPSLWTSVEAAKATRGDVTQDFVATGVSINTRTLNRGDLFIALVGPNADGHDHVAKAFEMGAAAAVVSHRPPVFDPDTPLLMVEDTMQALEDLGVYARNRFKGKVIAVTGSVGKTGTKEALNLVLSDQAKTAANIGSLNNHWGLPLSLARMEQDALYGVMELGMNHPGELIPLSKMTQPDVCLITTVQAAHTEFFASTAEIAKAKAEIFQGAKPGWTAVINADIQETDQLQKAAKEHKASEVLTFGESVDADFRVIVYKMAEQGSDITAITPTGPVSYHIASPGRHWVLNSLGVLASVYALGGDVQKAAQSLAKLTPPKSRGERFDVQLKDGSFALIDESYNASPAAVCAALAVLGAQPVLGSSARIAVLGDMLELGDDTPKIHRDLGEVLIASGVNKVYLAGEAMQYLWDVLPKNMQGHHCSTSQELADVVKAVMKPGDVVMVKGSAGSKMDVVVKELRALNINQNRGES